MAIRNAQLFDSLRDSESRLRGIAASALDAVILIDNDGNVSFWNDAASRMFGYGREEILGKYLHSFIVPERHIDQFKKGFAAFQTTGKGPFIGTVYEIEAKKKNGNEFPVELSLAAVMLKGKWNAVGIVRDISERKRAMEALRKAMETNERQVAHLNALVAQMTEGLAVFDPEGNLLDMNEAALKIYGFESVEGLRSDIKGLKEIFELFDLEGRSLPLEQWPISRARRGETFEAYELRVRRRDTGKTWINSYHGAPVKDRTGQVILLILTMRDITGQKKLEEEIMHMAHHDPLTGLPNRRLFKDIANVEREQANRHRKKMALLFLDLDRFKEINDTLGHEAGDILLKETASRLKSLVRKSDTIARIGGDEFNIILTDIDRPEDTADIAENIIASFQKPFRINSHDLNVTTSIGISIYPDDNEDIDTLLRFADISMYHAKELGRNRYEFYNQSINVKSWERIRLETMLQRSLELGEMVLYYQPLVDIRSRRIACAEALVRWKHPEKGLLLPKDFIPAAVETGFINVIDLWSLKTVCRQVRTWLDSGSFPICVTVNLSARQFQHPELVKTVSSILKETGTPPDCLDIEITETAAMSDVERSAVLLKELSNMGIRISIDDFGTGYSSLNYLRRLPIQCLKIDRSFIQDIPGNADDKTIVKAVTAMAHKMKMKVVAEGVETKEQLKFLRKAGCDEMQGFLFSEPLPEAEFTKLITAGA